jgi:hypothetical protein
MNWQPSVLVGALLAAALSGPAQAQWWPILMDRHPGCDAGQASWAGAGRVAMACDSTLRLLDLSQPAWGLLLQHRQNLDMPLIDLRAGLRQAALLGSSGQLRMLDLESWESLEAGVATRLASEEGTLLAASSSGLRSLDLDSEDATWTPEWGAFSHAPRALCLRNQVAWVLAADTLRSIVLTDLPPLPGQMSWLEAPFSMDAGGGLVLGALGDQGLRVIHAQDIQAPTLGTRWQPGFPVQDLRWWRDALWVLAAGDSGLALADFSQPDAPQLVGRWRTVASARTLDLRGDSLLVGEGPDGLSLHVLREAAGVALPELLARHATRPRILSWEEGQWDATTAWALDRQQGFRRFHWPERVGWPGEDPQPVELPGVGLPLPVDGGDWRAGLLAGCRFGAGLRYYAEEGEGFHLEGIHPTDPVKLLSWGPQDLVAYITPDAFIAIKQANRSPWFLRHLGTLALGGTPLCAAWSPDQHLWVGLEDGRLCQVDVGNPQAPVLEAVHQLAGPVRDISMDWEQGMSGVVAATSLYLLCTPYDTDAWQMADSVEAQAWPFTCASVNALYLFAGRDNPPVVTEMGVNAWEGTLHSSGDHLNLPAAPLSVGRRVTDGSVMGLGWVALENGDLVLVAGTDEVSIHPGPPRPGRLGLLAAPNPCNPGTRLCFTLPHAVTEARISLWDVAGRRCKELSTGPLQAGSHRLALDLGDLPAGLYLAQVRTASDVESVKLLLIP